MIRISAVAFKLFSCYVEGRLKEGQRCEETIGGYCTVQDRDDVGQD